MISVWYLLLGAFFGVTLYKSEVISWFRIQEMFRFDSFHLYGILGSAVVVAGIAMVLLVRFGTLSITGQPISSAKKPKGISNLLGGAVFGVGWALTGACPGPMYVHLGAGTSAMSVALVSAILGTWTYGLLRNRLPH